MNYPLDTELTGSRLLRIWWALVWRTTAIGGPLSVIKAWIMMRWVKAGVIEPMPGLILSDWLIYAVIFLGVLRSVLKKKRFRDFSIRLVKEV